MTARVDFWKSSVLHWDSILVNGVECSWRFGTRRVAHIGAAFRMGDSVCTKYHDSRLPPSRAIWLVLVDANTDKRGWCTFLGLSKVEHEIVGESLNNPILDTSRPKSTPRGVFWGVGICIHSSGRAYHLCILLVVYKDDWHCSRYLRIVLHCRKDSIRLDDQTYSWH